MPKYTATRIDEEVDIRLNDTNNKFEPTTMCKMFLNTAAKYSSIPALHYKKNGEWASYSWKEYEEKAKQFAKSLISLGFQAHDTVSISGFNSTEWFISYIGCILAGGASTGVYTTNGAQACKYVCNNSVARVVVCDGIKQLEKFMSIADQLPALKALVVWNASLPENVECAVPIYDFDAFLTIGNEIPDSTVDERIANQRPGHCASLIYTSGTTGNPKGVMLSHDNFTYTLRAVTSQFQNNLFDNTERVISYLPLSHIAGQILDIGIQIYFGLHIYFAEPDALKGSLGKTMKEVHPTFFLGVPRVYEKISEKMVEVGRGSKGIKKAIASWARRVGAQKVAMSQFHESGGKPCGYDLAKAIVFDKVRVALGLEKCKAFYSGAAPLSPEVIAFFSSLDIPIYEAMGLSETTAISFFNYPHMWKQNCLGHFLVGTNVKIDPENSELLIRGRHVMMGYINNEEGTAQALDDEGFLHTGDCASLDSDGFGYITGRLKELIITAGGENVPPVLIENVIKEELPLLGNVMVIGDKRKFLSAIFTLRVTVDEHGEPTDKLDNEAKYLLSQIGSEATTVGDAIVDPKIKVYLDSGLKRANARATSRAQNVQKYIFVTKDFSVPGGELTPTLKIKRNVVAKMYEAEIDAMYVV
ncbi:long-chain-fatty-acid-CoA ligase [Thraustotheca clavata]|uniref:Long-chain-fatty-acid-CoA ligase n=1 Tax=Thraustotheca clavata TaxID=74557 RepID=A0A1V9ZWB9_9STRA|nr:long-chain-fatty-acid-CoA ligase [Thraustotheca clavata]